MRLFSCLASLFAGLFWLCASDVTDKRPPWDAIKLVSFNRGDATDRSWLAQTPTTSAGVTFPAGYRAARFNGTSAWISYPDRAEQRAYPLTVCFWFNMQGLDQVQYSSIVDKYSTGSINGWQVWVDTSERIHAWYFGGSVLNCIYGGGDGLLFTPLGYKSAGWTHCAVTFSSSGGEIYINATSVDTQAWTGTPTAATTTHRLGIGQHNLSGSTYYGGDLDDLRIYNTVKTAAEIGAIYAEGIGASRP